MKTSAFASRTLFYPPDPLFTLLRRNIGAVLNFLLCPSHFIASYMTVVCVAEVMDVRLVGPLQNVGRVEALYGDIWIPICQDTFATAPYTDDPWTDLAASVVCKQLGFEAGGVAFPEYEENVGLTSSVGYRVNDVMCGKGKLYYYSRFRLQDFYYFQDTTVYLQDPEQTCTCLPHQLHL